MNIEEMQLRINKELKSIQYLNRLKLIDLSKYDGKRFTMRANKIFLDTGFELYRGYTDCDYWIRSKDQSCTRYHYVNICVFDYREKKFILDYERFKKRIEESIEHHNSYIKRYQKGIDVYYELQGLKNYLKTDKFKNLPHNMISDLW